MKKAFSFYYKIIFFNDHIKLGNEQFLANSIEEAKECIFKLFLDHITDEKNIKFSNLENIKFIIVDNLEEVEYDKLYPYLNN